MMIAFMMMGYYISRSFEGTLHVDKIHERFKIANITHALPVPVHWQTDFTPTRVVVSRFHDTVAKDFVPEWNSRSGTTTGVNSRRADSRRHYILWWASRKQMLSHEREPDWTRSGAKVAPVSRKHPLKVVGTQKWPISMAYALINLSSRPINAQKIALLLQNTCSKKPIVFTTSVSIEF